MECRHDLVTVGSRNGAAVAMLLLIAFYCVSNPSTRQGSFFGNAIADWTGTRDSCDDQASLRERLKREQATPRQNTVGCDGLQNPR